MTEAEPKSMFNRDLQCGWISWRVVDDNGWLHLSVPEGECPNMSSAVKIAEMLCPIVWRVDVFSGKKPDTSYVKFGKNGKWMAMNLGALAESEAF